MQFDSLPQIKHQNLFPWKNSILSCTYTKNPQPIYNYGDGTLISVNKFKPIFDFSQNIKPMKLNNKQMEFPKHIQFPTLIFWLLTHVKHETI